MPKQMISVKLSDTKYFYIIRGKRVTRKQIHDNPGEIPVFSGHKEAESCLGYVSENWLNENNIPIYNRLLITINSNGNVGRVFLREKPKYTFHDDVTGIEIVHKKIYPQYLVYAIREAIVKAYFRYDAKLYIKRLMPLEIKLPVDDDGKLDYDYQQELAIRFEQLQSLKKQVEDFSTSVTNCFITIDTEIGNHVFIELGSEDCFKFIRGKRVRKKDIHSHPGDIPVISSSHKSDGYLGYISENWLNSFLHPVFDTSLITINMDGSVGDVFLRNEEKYTLNDVVVAIDILEEKLNPIYIAYAIKEAVATASFKYGAKLYQKRLKKLKIRVPIDANGEFDWNQQEYIANKHEKLEEIKKAIKRFSSELEDKFITTEILPAKP